MQIEIKSYSNLLSRLEMGKNLQFVKNIITEVEAEIATIPELVDLFNDLKENWEQLEAIFLNNQTLYETRNIARKDKGRDFSMRALASRLSPFVRYPQSEEERLEALRLKLIINEHKQADKKEYETETTLIRAMISNLRQYDSSLVKYNLKEIVDRLEAANDEFDEQYNNRNQVRIEQKSLGKGHTVRRKMNRSFGNFCKAITGIMLLPFPSELKARMTRIIGLINMNIDQFMAIYHRHASIVARNRKKESSQTDSAGQAPKQEAKSSSKTPPASSEKS
ncbi:MAG: DUF6261 family protein [Tannerellaceae bacterium]|jgi:hypothetical protein|nr:DUF6261 family protein [Tannerellaceae bacterium]